MKHAIIFDFGGVLMKTLDYRPRHMWDERLGLPYDSVERIVHGSESWRLAQLGKITPDAYWQDIQQQLKLNETDLDQLQADFFKGDYLDGDLLVYIQQLRNAGHIVGLLSNEGITLTAKLNDLGITHLFDPLVISAQIGYMKPAPEAYHAVLDQISVPAAQTVFIDDMPANIAGAEAVGIHGILYTPELDLSQALRAIITYE